MPTPDGELPHAIARFWRPADGGDAVTGCGFLVEPRTLCTCAHVVASALGTDATDPESPPAPVTVDFPLLPEPSPRLTATVTHWRPVSGDGGGDIALLRLAEPVPGTAPVRFAGGTAVWDHRFRVLGFPPRTEDHGVWVRGRLRAPVGKGWTSMEATRPAPGTGPVIGQGFSGAPVWDAEQDGVVGMTVAADTGTGATTAYLIPAPLLLGLGEGPRPSPFRGLEPFREQDAAVFFARRADSERLAAALAAHPFVPVAGASGVGKSSLVRAGVLPLLRSSGHTVTDFVGQPDTDPVRTLAEALAVQFPPAATLARDLCAAPDRTGTAVLLGARVLAHGGASGHVILLDQFEETVGARPADARALLDVLLPMTRAVHPGGRHLRVLATLRSASLEDLVAGGRAEALSGTLQMVAPMTPGQLDQVVRRPLDTVPGVEFEPGLAERVVTDAGAEPGALPLVEFALAELWERQDRGRLTHAAYQEIGGVEGALSRYADLQLRKVCETPGGPDPAVARRLFERLARPVKGKEYARVARAFDHLPPELRAAAQSLARTRLLVLARDSSGRETVALAHESLVRQWPTLRDWLRDSHAFLTWHEKLRGRLREWEDSGRHVDLTLRGQELTAAREWSSTRPGELSPEETEFIRVSRLHRRRSVRRGRTGVALVACLAVLAGLLGVAAWDQFRGRGQEALDDAAGQLVEFAEHRAEDSPVDAALLALAARRTSDTPETRAALMNHELSLASLSSAHRILPPGTVQEIAASADGHHMAVLHEGPRRNRRVFLLSGLETETPRTVSLRGVPDLVDKVAVSDDGRQVAAGAGDGTVRVWHVGERVRDPLPWAWKPRDPAASETLTLDFSPDGRGLVHAVAPGGEDADRAPCDGDELADWLRVAEVGADAVREREAALPDGLLAPGECLEGVALKTGGLTVVAHRSADDADVYATRSSAGEAAWEGQSEVTLDPAGRTLGASASDDEFWRIRLDVEQWTGQKGRWPVNHTLRTDITGRYLLRDSRDELNRYQDTVGRQLIQDLVTGERYSAVLPLRTAWFGVVRTPGGTPLLYATAGEDLLAFQAVPTGYPPGGTEPGGVLDMDLAADSGALATLSQRSTGPESEDYSVSLAVSGPRGRQHGPLALAPYVNGPEESVVANRAGTAVVGWRTDGWALHGGDRLARVAADADRAGHPVEVDDVQPYGATDFLLLTGEGLVLLDGRTGARRPLPEVGCVRRTRPEQRGCVQVVGRPGHEGQFLVLRDDGGAELWRLRGRAVSRGPTAVLTVPRDTTRGAIFRSDGEVVALATGTGIDLWRPERGAPERFLADGFALGDLYGRGGILVGARGGEVELRDDASGERLATLHAAAHVWDLDGRHLRGHTDFGPLTYDLGRLTDGDPRRLCALLGPHPPDVRESPTVAALTLPAEADMAPPCREHP
ncbi:trypsin-like peptidase domain-containing protein [Streptomyces sp. NPDC006997]|uniref:nSTAND1 domain-containing NTPase n=1 Tax=Streptomyces sp. NPDC006997 TaxID=3155356 RepID=UPI0034084BF7